MFSYEFVIVLIVQLPKGMFLYRDLFYTDDKQI